MPTLAVGINAAGARLGAAQANEAFKSISTAAQLADLKAKALNKTLGDGVPAIGGLTSALGQLVPMLGTLASIGGIAALAMKAITTAAHFESVELGFTTILKSADKAKVMLDDLKKFGAETPFEFDGIAQTSKQLLAMGFQAKDVIPMLTDLGDAVSALGGSQQTLDSVATALGRMQNSGKVTSREMMELTTAGIPAWKFLAAAVTDAQGRMMSMSEVQDKVEKGAITSQEAIAALLKGMRENYGGGMAALSKTTEGLWSNLKDAATYALSDIGKEIIKAFNVHEGIKSATDAIGGLKNAVLAIIQRIEEAYSWFQKMNRESEAFKTAVEIAEGAVVLLAAAMALNALKDFSMLIGGWTKAMIGFQGSLWPTLATLAALAAILASFEFGRYLVSEFKLVAEASFAFYMGFKGIIADLEHGLDSLIADVHNLGKIFSAVIDTIHNTSIKPTFSSVSYNGIGASIPTGFSVSTKVALPDLESEYKAANEKWMKTKAQIEKETTGGMLDIDMDFGGKSRQGKTFTEKLEEDLLHVKSLLVETMNKFLELKKTTEDDAAKTHKTIGDFPDEGKTGNQETPIEVEARKKAERMAFEESIMRQSNIQRAVSLQMYDEEEKNLKKGTAAYDAYTNAVIRYETAKVVDTMRQQNDSLSEQISLVGKNSVQQAQYNEVFKAWHEGILIDNPALLQRVALIKKLADAQQEQKMKESIEDMRLETQYLGANNGERQVAIEKLRLHRAGYNELSEAAENYYQEIRNADKAKREFDLGQQTEDLQTEIDGLGKSNYEKQRATELLRLTREGWDANDEAVQRYLGKLKELDEAKKVEALAGELADAFGNAFEGMIDGTKSVSEAFKQLAQDIEKALLQALVIKPLTQSLTGMFNGMLGSGGLNIGSFLGSANGNAFSMGSLTAFANGEVFGSPMYFPMAGGRTGLLGERGPEAIMPLERGSDGKLGVRSDGGSQTVINMKVYANDANSFRSSERQIIGKAKRAAGQR